MNVTVSEVVRLECSLGEGLHWDPARNLVWMVDIAMQQLICIQPDSGKVGRRTLPEPVGWVQTLRGSTNVLLGLASGIAQVNPFDPASDLKWWDKTFPGRRDHRLNDGKADKFGRMWSGSLHLGENPPPTGQLAFYTPEESKWTVVGNGYKIPNGPAFDQDCSVMLHSDSASRTTFRYDLDIEDGSVLNCQVWRQFSAREGLPDGMNFDSEDHVWIAHWGSGYVRRYDQSGVCVLEVKIPAINVTNVCFGGPSLERIFVSSARQHPGSHEPDAGSLFEIHGTGVTGFDPWQVSPQLAI